MIELAITIALIIILVPIALFIIVVVGGGALGLIGVFLWNITFGLFQDQKEFMTSKKGVYGMFDKEKHRPKEKNVSYAGPFKMTRLTPESEKSEE